jgi:hypothetical protein
MCDIPVQCVIGIFFLPVVEACECFVICVGTLSQSGENIEVVQERYVEEIFIL